LKFLLGGSHLAPQGRPPHGGRGLKSIARVTGAILESVAPHTGGVD